MQRDLYKNRHLPFQHFTYKVTDLNNKIVAKSSQNAYGMQK